MLEELNILNGEMSLKFDPLNTKYTVFLDNNDKELNLEYKLKEGTNIIIEGNYNLDNGSVVVLTISDNEESVNYVFNVYVKEDREVSKSDTNLVELEIDSQKEISEYAGPGIASICFLLIMFLFVFLFHKKKIK